MIESRRERLLTGYTERHHIIPKCMGGDDSMENLISLTAREHFIAHWLLWRIHGTYPLAYAFFAMCIWKNGKQDRIKTSSRAYQEAREAAKLTRSEFMKTVEGKELYKKMGKGRIKPFYNFTQEDAEGNVIRYWTMHSLVDEMPTWSSTIRNALKNEVAAYRFKFYWKREDYSSELCISDFLKMKRKENAKVRKGRVWLTNGKKSTHVKYEDVENLLKHGWKKGKHWI